MSTSPERQIAPIREEPRRELSLVGLSGTFTGPQGIPELWQKFAPYLGKIPGQIGRVTYGINFIPRPGSNEFEYMAAVEVADFAGVPKELKQVVIPGQTYQIFQHQEHVSGFSSTIRKIMNSGYIKPAPEGQVGLIEYYGERFDPKSGFGDMEIWVPIRP